MLGQTRQPVNVISLTGEPQSDDRTSAGRVHEIRQVPGRVHHGEIPSDHEVQEGLPLFPNASHARHAHGN